MVPFHQVSQDPYINVGLNNIVARETHVELLNNADTPTERQRYNIWPVLKRAVSSNLMEGGKVVHKLTCSQSSPSLRDHEYQFSQFSFGAITKSKLQRQGSLSSRRKISFPELGIAPMTTVQEHYMDSPTIPGRFPVHERSNSAPGGSGARNTFEETVLDPVSEPFILFSDDEDFKMASAINAKLHDAVAGASGADYDSPIDSGESTPTTKKPKTEPEPEPEPELEPEPDSEKPPAVPPKSPRMIGRSPAMSQRPVASKYSLPPRKAPPPIETKTLSRKESGDTGSANTYITNQLRRPDLRPRAATAVEIRPPESLPSKVHQRSESVSAGTGPSTEASERCERSECFGAKYGHKKQLSETLSIMDRGRPTRRRSHNKNETLKKIPSADSVALASLPTGFNPLEAASLFSITDVERLQDQARIQAQKFEVLKYTDAKALSRELRVLDERCEYLRTTHKSLRSGRNSLHGRMITYLRSPRMTKFCRENMLKQEEALAELDQSIDEWVVKLEQVESRRARVRQKLLEHVAAALILQVTAASQVPERQTPPQSPVNSENDSDITRQESIKIYADSKVYADAHVSALFADIEREMELMNRARNNPSRLENHGTA